MPTCCVAALGELWYLRVRSALPDAECWNTERSCWSVFTLMVSPMPAKNAWSVPPTTGTCGTRGPALACETRVALPSTTTLAAAIIALSCLFMFGLIFGCVSCLLAIERLDATERRGHGRQRIDGLENHDRVIVVPVAVRERRVFEAQPPLTQVDAGSLVGEHLRSQAGIAAVL